MEASTRPATPLAEVLLARLPNLEVSPLFNSQAEVTRAILRLDEPGYSDEPTLRSYLNQVLVGRRPCNEKLQATLLKAATARVRDARQKRLIAQLIVNAARTHNESINRGRTLHLQATSPVSDLLNQMLQHQRSADSVFVMTMRPLEAIPVVSASEFPVGTFREIAFEAVRSGVPYTYCVPTRDAAVRLWQIFLERTSVEGESAEGGNHAIGSNDATAALSVYQLPLRYCVDPRIICNPGLPGRAFGWIWYAPWDPRRIVQMPPEALEYWTKEYWEPIRQGRFEGLVKISPNDVLLEPKTS